MAKEISFGSLVIATGKERESNMLQLNTVIEQQLTETYRRQYENGCPLKQMYNEKLLRVPTILPPRVQFPSMPSLLFRLKYLHYICHVKRTKINKKRPGLAHF